MTDVTEPTANVGVPTPRMPLPDWATETHPGEPPAFVAQITVIPEGSTDPANDAVTVSVRQGVRQVVGSDHAISQVRQPATLVVHRTNFSADQVPALLEAITKAQGLPPFTQD